MITAVTERSINAQLQAMHSNNESLRRILLTSPDTDDDWTGLNAELSAPTVQLKIGTEGLFYSIQFPRLLYSTDTSDRSNCSLLREHQGEQILIEI